MLTRDDKLDKLATGRQVLQVGGPNVTDIVYRVANPALLSCQDERAEPNGQGGVRGEALSQFSEQLRWHGMAGF